MECSSAIRRNEALVRATTHTKLENIMKEDKHETTYCMTSFTLLTLITEKSGENRDHFITQKLC